MRQRIRWRCLEWGRDFLPQRARVLECKPRPGTAVVAAAEGSLSRFVGRQVGPRPSERRRCLHTVRAGAGWSRAGVDTREELGEGSRAPIAGLCRPLGLTQAQRGRPLAWSSSLPASPRSPFFGRQARRPRLLRVVRPFVLEARRCRQSRGWAQRGGGILLALRIALRVPMCVTVPHASC